MLTTCQYREMLNMMLTHHSCELVSVDVDVSLVKCIEITVIFVTMEYRHKSGAQKRKEREDRIKKATKCNRTLFQFGIGSNEELESTTLSFEGTSIQNVDAGTKIVANDLIESVGLLPETVTDETDRPITDINNRKSVTNDDSYIQSTRSECTSSGTHEKDGLIFEFYLRAHSVTK